MPKTKDKKTETKSKPKTKPKTKAKAKAEPKVKAKAPTKKPAAKKTAKKDLKPVITVTHDAIAKRAFELWLDQGCPDGCAEKNWDEAEKELAGA